MHIGIFGAPGSIDDFVERARTAADDGFDMYWVPQIAGLDALAAIAVAGREVPELSFGTSVIPTYPRHPMALAQQALTAQQATGGRVTLGVGLSHKMVVEGRWGLSFDRPLRHMREYLEILVPLVRGETVDFSGETLTGRGAVAIKTDPCPVLVAALGPKMLELAGRVADGTITWMTGAGTIASHAAPRIREAAQAAGRPEPQIVVALPVSLSDDVAGTRAQAAEEFAIYGSLPSYRAMLDREGVDGPEDLAIIGDEAEVTARIEEVVAAGATSFVAAEFGPRDDRAATRELLKALND